MEPIIIIICVLIFVVNLVTYLIERENEQAIRDMRLAVEQAQADILDLAGRVERMQVAYSVREIALRDCSDIAFKYTNRKRPVELADDDEVTVVMSNGNVIEGRVDQLYWSNILAYKGAL